MENLPTIRRIFLANTISGIAQGISVISIPWYFANIYEKSSLWMLIYATANILGLFWSLYSGTLVDRLDRKKLLMAENIVGALVMIAVGTYGLYLGYVPSLLAAIVFSVSILIFTTHYPTQFAFIQEILPPKDYIRMTSYLEIQGQLTSVFSGALAAMLLTGFQYDFQLLGMLIPISIPKWDLTEIFLLDGLTYIITFFVVSSISYYSITERTIDQGGLWERYKQGIQYFKKEPIQFVFGNASFTIFLTILLSAFAVNPTYITKALQADSWVYCLSEIAFALGAILSGIFIRRIFHQGSPVKGILAMTLFCVIAYLLMATVFHTWLFIGLFLFIGLCNAGARILRFQFILTTIPNRVIGRTSGVVLAINFMIRIFFGLLFSLPFFIEHIHITYYIFSGLCMLAAMALFYYRKPLDALYERARNIPN